MKDFDFGNFVAIYLGNYRVDLGAPALNNIDFQSDSQRNSCIAFHALGFKIE